VSTVQDISPLASPTFAAIHLGTLQEPSLAMSFAAFNNQVGAFKERVTLVDAVGNRVQMGEDIAWHITRVGKLYFYKLTQYTTNPTLPVSWPAGKGYWGLLIPTPDGATVMDPAIDGGVLTCHVATSRANELLETYSAFQAGGNLFGLGLPGIQFGAWSVGTFSNTHLANSGFLAEQIHAGRSWSAVSVHFSVMWQ
jgi:hypothetical protein